jgi:flagellar protein FlgJ
LLIEVEFQQPKPTACRRPPNQIAVAMSTTIPSITIPTSVSPPKFSATKSQGPDELRQQFTQFVGEAFFGQMLKAMRATVGKPAYFHGGRAEEVFQGQLDQHLSEHLTETSAERFANPMFERQFPQFAEKKAPSGFDQLSQLRRM